MPKKKEENTKVTFTTLKTEVRLFFIKKGFWDETGYYFNKDGFDKHGGSYGKDSVYIPGKDWDSVNMCYPSDLEKSGQHNYYDDELLVDDGDFNDDGYDDGFGGDFEDDGFGDDFGGEKPKYEKKVYDKEVKEKKVLIKDEPIKVEKVTIVETPVFAQKVDESGKPKSKLASLFDDDEPVKKPNVKGAKK